MAVQEYKLQEYEIFLPIFFIPTFSCPDPIPASLFTPLCLVFFCRFDCKEGRAASACACYVGPESIAGRRGPLAPQGQCGCSFWQRVPGGCSTARSQGSLRKADHGSRARGRTLGTGSGEECLQRQVRTLMTVSAVFYGNKLSRPNPTANG